MICVSTKLFWFVRNVVRHNGLRIGLVLCEGPSPVRILSQLLNLRRLFLHFRFRGYYEPPFITISNQSFPNPDRYQFSTAYWHILTAKLFFVVAFLVRTLYLFCMSFLVWIIGLLWLLMMMMMSFFFKFIKTVLYIYSQISLKEHLAKIDGLPVRRTFLEDGRIAHDIS